MMLALPLLPGWEKHHAEMARIARWSRIRGTNHMPSEHRGKRDEFRWGGIWEDFLEEGAASELGSEGGRVWTIEAEVERHPMPWKPHGKGSEPS